MQTFQYPSRSEFEAQTLVRQLHEGDLFVFEGTEASRALISQVHDVLRTTPGLPALPSLEGPYPAASHEALTHVRETLYGQCNLRGLAAQIVAEFSQTEGTYLDNPRLRAVTAGAEAILDAAPVFVAHRDTWYSCDQAQINWWVPVFDCPKSQAFVFYPEYFDTAVPNASQDFDYARWMKNVGWHGQAPLSEYPAPFQPVEATESISFDMKAGDILLFASAHLHQTLPNRIAGSSRLSLDFRSVLPGGAASPNADNQSRGAELRMQEQFRPVTSLL